MDIVSRETFTTLTPIWTASASTLDWGLVFTLPPWLEVWWRHFHTGGRLYLASVRENDEILGIAPLQVKKGIASFIGDTDVCDFQDFIVAPGRHAAFFSNLLRQLDKNGIKRLELGHVRPESTVRTHLMRAAEAGGWRTSDQIAAASYEMELPVKFDDYLEYLNGKQRHEVRRKIRRLEEIGALSYRTVQDRADVEKDMPLFLKFFTESRSDKASFMTAPMAAFFRDMAVVMADARILRFGVLDVDRKPAAMVLYFDYRGVRYLYNSGYDPAFVELSAGLVSKVFCVRDAIEKGFKRFDFLKGPEPYKQYLGGQEVPLYTCSIKKEA